MPQESLSFPTPQCRWYYDTKKTLVQGVCVFRAHLWHRHFRVFANSTLKKIFNKDELTACKISTMDFGHIIFSLT